MRANAFYYMRERLMIFSERVRPLLNSIIGNY